MASRRLTTGEKNQLLSDFYRDIYEGERNFADTTLPDFAGEEFGDDSDEDFEAEENDDVDVATELDDAENDPNRDEDVEVDIEEPTAARPKKQKFANVEKLCDSNNYDRLPDQPDETFVWSNKAGDRYEWCTMTAGYAENVSRRGLTPAANICKPGGPTRAAKNKSNLPSETWSLMIPDDIIMKIAEYTNTKTSELHTIIGDPLDENDKKTLWFDVFI